MGTNACVWDFRHSVASCFVMFMERPPSGGLVFFFGHLCSLSPGSTSTGHFCFCLAGTSRVQMSQGQFPCSTSWPCCSGSVSPGFLLLLGASPPAASSALGKPGFLKPAPWASRLGLSNPSFTRHMQAQGSVGFCRTLQPKPWCDQVSFPLLHTPTAPSVSCQAHCSLLSPFFVSHSCILPFLSYKLTHLKEF